MVLAHLLHQSGHMFDLAHCNFGLRGAESDADEQFCRDTAKAMGFGFHVAHFQTAEYAAQHKLSIQVAARELRYNWFNQLKEQHRYNCILTAHHADDSIETFFVNLARGTGISGLQGIHASHKGLVRPLLFAFKAEILQYAASQRLAYRHDSSNEKIVYQRNFIRHEVIPKFRQLNSAFGYTMLNNMDHLAESAAIIQEFTDRQFALLCRKQGQELWIDHSKLVQEPYKKTLLFSWLHPFGFNPAQVGQVLNCLDAGAFTGKIFLSGAYRLLADRQYLVVTQKGEHTEDRFTIASPLDTVHLPIGLSIVLSNDTEISRERCIACLDADLVTFPLTLRRWQEGDRFIPLGMQGHKKLSDFFTAEKMNLTDKENIWVLESNNAIVWIVDHRIDDRFKITEQTKRMLKISYI